MVTAARTHSSGVGIVGCLENSASLSAVQGEPSLRQEHRKGRKEGRKRCKRRAQHHIQRAQPTRIIDNEGITSKIHQIRDTAARDISSYSSTISYVERKTPTSKRRRCIWQRSPVLLSTRLDRRAVGDAGLLDLQRGDHARFMPHMVLACVKLLGKKRLRQTLEPAIGTMCNKKNCEIRSDRLPNQHSTPRHTDSTTRAAGKYCAPWNRQLCRENRGPLRPCSTMPKQSRPLEKLWRRAAGAKRRRGGWGARCCGDPDKSAQKDETTRGEQRNTSPPHTHTHTHAHVTRLCREPGGMPYQDLGSPLCT